MSPRPPVASATAPLADGESGKLVRLGIQRDLTLMYYIKAGDVWAVPRKEPGKASVPAFKVASAGVEMDYENYLYYLDLDGDIARKRRSKG